MSNKDNKSTNRNHITINGVTYDRVTGRIIAQTGINTDTAIKAPVLDENVTAPNVSVQPNPFTDINTQPSSNPLEGLTINTPSNKHPNSMFGGIMNKLNDVGLNKGFEPLPDETNNINTINSIDNSNSINSIDSKQEELNSKLNLDIYNKYLEKEEKAKTESERYFKNSNISYNYLRNVDNDDRYYTITDKIDKDNTVGGLIKYNDKVFENAESLFNNDGNINIYSKGAALNNMLGVSVDDYINDANVGAFSYNTATSGGVFKHHVPNKQYAITNDEDEAHFRGYDVDMARADFDLRYQRAANQGTLSKLGVTLANIIPNSISMFVGGIGGLGAFFSNSEGDYSNFLTKTADALRNVAGEAYRYNPNETWDWSDPAWWFTNGASIVESGVGFMGVGIGVGMAFKGASKLGLMAAKASPLSIGGRGMQFFGSKAANTYIPAVSSSVAMAYAEGAGSAKDVFQEHYTAHRINGLTHEEASKRAARGAAATVQINTALNSALNITLMAPFFSSYTRGLAKVTQKGFDRLKSAISLKGSASETAQTLSNRLKPQVKAKPNVADDAVDAATSKLDKPKDAQPTVGQDLGDIKVNTNQAGEVTGGVKITPEQRKKLKKGEVEGLTIDEMIRNVDNATHDGKKGLLSRITPYLLEGAQETLEEANNYFATETGNKIAKMTDTEYNNKYGTSNAIDFSLSGLYNDLTKMETWANYASTLFSSEGAFSGTMGFMGGVFMKFAMRKIPMKRVERRHVDGPNAGQVMVDSNNKPIMRWANESSIEKEQEIIAFNQAKLGLAQDLQTLKETTEELTSVYGEPESAQRDYKIKMLNNKIFDVHAFNSIQNGNFELLEATYKNLGMISNKPDPKNNEVAAKNSESLKSILDSYVRDTPVEEQDAVYINNMNNDIERYNQLALIPELTEAMMKGLATDPNDNSYQERANEALQHLKDAKQTYDSIMRKLDYDDYRTRRTAQIVFNLQMRKKSLERELEIMKTSTEHISKEARDKVGQQLNILENINNNPKLGTLVDEATKIQLAEQALRDKYDEKFKRLSMANEAIRKAVENTNSPDLEVINSALATFRELSMELADTLSYDDNFIQSKIVQNDMKDIDATIFKANELMRAYTQYLNNRIAENNDKLNKNFDEQSKIIDELSEGTDNENKLKPFLANPETRQQLKELYNSQLEQLKENDKKQLEQLALTEFSIQSINETVNEAMSIRGSDAIATAGEKIIENLNKKLRKKLEDNNIPVPDFLLDPKEEAKKKEEALKKAKEEQAKKEAERAKQEAEELENKQKDAANNPDAETTRVETVIQKAETLTNNLRTLSDNYSIVNVNTQNVRLLKSVSQPFFDNVALLFNELESLLDNKEITINNKAYRVRFEERTDKYNGLTKKLIITDTDDNVITLDDNLISSLSNTVIKLFEKLILDNQSNLASASDTDKVQINSNIDKYDKLIKFVNDYLSNDRLSKDDKLNEDSNQGIITLNSLLDLAYSNDDTKLQQLYEFMSDGVYITSSKGGDITQPLRSIINSIKDGINTGKLSTDEQLALNDLLVHYTDMLEAALLSSKNKPNTTLTITSGRTQGSMYNPDSNNIVIGVPHNIINDGNYMFTDILHEFNHMLVIDNIVGMNGDPLTQFINKSNAEINTLLDEWLLSAFAIQDVSQVATKYFGDIGYDTLTDKQKMFVKFKLISSLIEQQRNYQLSQGGSTIPLMLITRLNLLSSYLLNSNVRNDNNKSIIKGDTNSIQALINGVSDDTVDTNTFKVFVLELLAQMTTDNELTRYLYNVEYKGGDSEILANKPKQTILHRVKQFISRLLNMIGGLKPTMFDASFERLAKIKTLANVNNEFTKVNNIAKVDDVIKLLNNSANGTVSIRLNNSRLRFTNASINKVDSKDNVYDLVFTDMNGKQYTETLDANGIYAMLISGATLHVNNKNNIDVSTIIDYDIKGVSAIIKGSNMLLGKTIKSDDVTDNKGDNTKDDDDKDKNKDDEPDTDSVKLEEITKSITELLTALNQSIQVKLNELIQQTTLAVNDADLQTTVNNLLGNQDYLLINELNKLLNKGLSYDDLTMLGFTELNSIKQLIEANIDLLNKVNPDTNDTAINLIKQMILNSISSNTDVSSTVDAYNAYLNGLNQRLTNLSYNEVLNTIINEVSDTINYELAEADKVMNDNTLSVEQKMEQLNQLVKDLTEHIENTSNNITDANDRNIFNNNINTQLSKFNSAINSHKTTLVNIEIANKVEQVKMAYAQSLTQNATPDDVTNAKREVLELEKLYDTNGKDKAEIGKIIADVIKEQIDLLSGSIDSLQSVAKMILHSKNVLDNGNDNINDNPYKSLITTISKRIFNASLAIQDNTNLTNDEKIKRLQDNRNALLGLFNTANEVSTTDDKVKRENAQKIYDILHADLASINKLILSNYENSNFVIDMKKDNLDTEFKVYSYTVKINELDNTHEYTLVNTNNPNDVIVIDNIDGYIHITSEQLNITQDRGLSFKNKKVKYNGVAEVIEHTNYPLGLKLFNSSNQLETLANIKSLPLVLKKLNILFLVNNSIQETAKEYISVVLMEAFDKAFSNLANNAEQMKKELSDNLQNIRESVLKELNHVLTKDDSETLYDTITNEILNNTNSIVSKLKMIEYHVNNLPNIVNNQLKDVQINTQIINENDLRKQMFNLFKSVNNDPTKIRVKFIANKPKNAQINPSELTPKQLKEKGLLHYNSEKDKAIKNGQSVIAIKSNYDSSKQLDVEVVFEIDTNEGVMTYNFGIPFKNPNNHVILSNIGMSNIDYIGYYQQLDKAQTIEDKQAVLNSLVTLYDVKLDANDYDTDEDYINAQINKYKEFFKNNIEAQLIFNTVMNEYNKLAKDENTDVSNGVVIDMSSLLNLSTLGVKLNYAKKEDDKVDLNEDVSDEVLDLFKVTDTDKIVLMSNLKITSGGLELSNTLNHSFDAKDQSNYEQPNLSFNHRYFVLTKSLDGKLIPVRATPKPLTDTLANQELQTIHNNFNELFKLLSLKNDTNAYQTKLEGYENNPDTIPFGLSYDELVNVILADKDVDINTINVINQKINNFIQSKFYLALPVSNNTSATISYGLPYEITNNVDVSANTTDDGTNLTEVNTESITARFKMIGVSAKIEHYATGNDEVKLTTFVNKLNFSNPTNFINSIKASVSNELILGSKISFVKVVTDANNNEVTQPDTDIIDTFAQLTMNGVDNDANAVYKNNLITLLNNVSSLNSIQSQLNKFFNKANKQGTNTFDAPLVSLNTIIEILKNNNYDINSIRIVLKNDGYNEDTIDYAVDIVTGVFNNIFNKGQNTDKFDADKARIFVNFVETFYKLSDYNKETIKGDEISDNRQQYELNELSTKSIKRVIPDDADLMKMYQADNEEFQTYIKDNFDIGLNKDRPYNISYQTLSLLGFDALLPQLVDGHNVESNNNNSKVISNNKIKVTAKQSDNKELIKLFALDNNTLQSSLISSRNPIIITPITNNKLRAKLQSIGLYNPNTNQLTVYEYIDNMLNVLGANEYITILGLSTLITSQLGLSGDNLFSEDNLRKLLESKPDDYKVSNINDVLHVQKKPSIDSVKVNTTNTTNTTDTGTTDTGTSTTTSQTVTPLQPKTKTAETLLKDINSKLKDKATFKIVELTITTDKVTTTTKVLISKTLEQELTNKGYDVNKVLNLLVSKQTDNSKIIVFKSVKDTYNNNKNVQNILNDNQVIVSQLTENDYKSINNYDNSKASQLNTAFKLIGNTKGLSKNIINTLNFFKFDTTKSPIKQLTDAILKQHKVSITTENMYEFLILYYAKYEGKGANKKLTNGDTNLRTELKKLGFSDTIIDNEIKTIINTIANKQQSKTEPEQLIDKIDAEQAKVADSIQDTVEELIAINEEQEELNRLKAELETLKNESEQLKDDISKANETLQEQANEIQQLQGVSGTQGTQGTQDVSGTQDVEGVDETLNPLQQPPANTELDKIKLEIQRLRDEYDTKLSNRNLSNKDSDEATNNLINEIVRIGTELNYDDSFMDYLNSLTKSTDFTNSKDAIVKAHIKLRQNKLDFEIKQDEIRERERIKQQQQEQRIAQQQQELDNQKQTAKQELINKAEELKQLAEQKRRAEELAEQTNENAIQQRENRTEVINFKSTTELNDYLKLSGAKLIVGDTVESKEQLNTQFVYTVVEYNSTNGEIILELKNQSILNEQNYIGLRPQAYDLTVNDKLKNVSKLSTNNLGFADISKYELVSHPKFKLTRNTNGQYSTMSMIKGEYEFKDIVIVNPNNTELINGLETTELNKSKYATLPYTNADSTNVKALLNYLMFDVGNILMVRSSSNNINNEVNSIRIKINNLLLLISNLSNKSIVDETDSDKESKAILTNYLTDKLFNIVKASMINDLRRVYLEYKSFDLSIDSLNDLGISGDSIKSIALQLNQIFGLGVQPQILNNNDRFGITDADTQQILDSSKGIIENVLAYASNINKIETITLKTKKGTEYTTSVVKGDMFNFNDSDYKLMVNPAFDSVFTFNMGKGYQSDSLGITKMNKLSELLTEDNRDDDALVIKFIVDEMNKGDNPFNDVTIFKDFTNILRSIANDNKYNVLLSDNISDLALEPKEDTTKGNVIDAVGTDTSTDTSTDALGILSDEDYDKILDILKLDENVRTTLYTKYNIDENGLDFVENNLIGSIVSTNFSELNLDDVKEFLSLNKLEPLDDNVLNDIQTELINLIKGDTDGTDIKSLSNMNVFDLLTQSTIRSIPKSYNLNVRSIINTSVLKKGC